jgi:hypothetical protein
MKKAISVSKMAFVLACLAFIFGCENWFSKQEESGTGVDSGTSEKMISVAQQKVLAAAGLQTDGTVGTKAAILDSIPYTNKAGPFINGDGWSIMRYWYPAEAKNRIDTFIQTLPSDVRYIVNTTPGWKTDSGTSYDTNGGLDVYLSRDYSEIRSTEIGIRLDWNFKTIWVAVDTGIEAKLGQDSSNGSNSSGGNSGQFSMEDSLAVKEAVETGVQVATGSRGDYIVKVPSTPKLREISKREKTAMFLSTSPFAYVQNGYILINVVTEYGQYRILDADIQTYNNGLYAVEVYFAGELGADGYPHTLELGSVPKEKVLGKWNVVDFVSDVPQFKPGQKQWSGTLDFLTALEFTSVDKVGYRIGGSTNWWNYTSSYLGGSGNSEARYCLLEHATGTYLFMEWMSGDVTIQGRKPYLYVFKKN